jgi:hypothetical protein
VNIETVHGRVVAHLLFERRQEESMLDWVKRASGESQTRRGPVSIDKEADRVLSLDSVSERREDSGECSFCSWTF